MKRGCGEIGGCSLQSVGEEREAGGRKAAGREAGGQVHLLKAPMMGNVCRCSKH